MNILLWLYVAVVMLLHLVPLGDVGIDQYNFGAFRADYLLHSLVFVPFVPIALCCRLKMERGFSDLRIVFQRPHSVNAVVLMTLLGILIAIGAEGIQLWVSYRSYNPLDLLFNVAGAISSGFFGFILTLGHD